MKKVTDSALLDKFIKSTYNNLCDEMEDIRDVIEQARTHGEGPLKNLSCKDICKLDNFLEFFCLFINANDVQNPLKDVRKNYLSLDSAPIPRNIRNSIENLLRQMEKELAKITEMN